MYLNFVVIIIFIRYSRCICGYLLLLIVLLQLLLLSLFYLNYYYDHYYYMYESALINT